MSDTQVAPENTGDLLRSPQPPSDEPVYVDYFDTDITFQYTLPDGQQWIEHKLLNEGDRRKYLNATQRDVRIDRQRQDMHMRMAAGDDRTELLKIAIVGWNLYRKNAATGRMEQVPFKSVELHNFLSKASPKLLGEIERAVRRENPWLVADATLEDIDRQIEELEEMKRLKIEEEEGKGSTSER